MSLRSGRHSQPTRRAKKSTSDAATSICRRPGLSPRWATMSRRRTRVCWWTNPNRPTLKILATASAPSATVNPLAISRSRLVLYGLSKPELEQLGAEFTGLFTNADGNLFSESYNQLNAYPSYTESGSSKSPNGQRGLWPDCPGGKGSELETF